MLPSPFFVNGRINAGLGGWRVEWLMKTIWWILVVVASFSLALAQTVNAGGVTTLRSTLRLTSAYSGRTFSNFRISTTSGDCVHIDGASNVTFENSNIGPCAGRGIHIEGGSGNNVYDSYIHVEQVASGCCDTHDGVFVNNASHVTIQGNVIAYGEANIESIGSGGIVISGNFLLNPQGPFPRGQQIQTGTGSNVTVMNNFALSTPDKTLGPAIGTNNPAPILFGQDNTGNRPSDSMNFYQTQTVLAENNYITGGLDATRPYSGGDQSASGCGLITDGSDSLVDNNASFKKNILVNTGPCGIGIGCGKNQTVVGNRTINLNPNNGGDTADYIWNQRSPACGPVLMSGNVATEIKSNGYASGYWNGGGCGLVTCDGKNTNLSSCNVFDSGSRRTAYDMLTPIATKLVPPLIPPLPKNCVVRSPYTTQMSLPSC